MALACNRRFRGLLTCVIAIITAGPGRGENEPPASADVASARPGLLVRLPDGRGLNFRCSGHGRLTVLFESGFAGTSLAWSRVVEPVAIHHRACAYDRAGSGFSDEGPEPRDATAIARDLDQGLKAAGLTGPFILVAHSAGALYARAFADLRPAMVSGMVLVDPSVEYQDVRLRSRFGDDAGSVAALRARAARCLEAAQQGLLPSSEATLRICTASSKPDQSRTVRTARLAEALRPGVWRTQISELDNLWTRSSDEVAAGRRSYGAIPLVVLTAGGPLTGPETDEQAAYLAYWASLHQELAARSTRGVQQTVPGASHLMMIDRPDAIVEAIERAASQ